MDNYEPKKLLILRILEILTEYSDSNHKLRQLEIISLLKALYGIECERKAVARNIEFLQQAGYEVVTDKDGSYLAEKKYEIGELRLLIDSVLANRNVCKLHTRQLIEKLAKRAVNISKTMLDTLSTLMTGRRTTSRTTSTTWSCFVKQSKTTNKLNFSITVTMLIINYLTVQNTNTRQRHISCF